MVTCSVVGCCTTRYNNPDKCSFHRFPFDSDTRKSWLRMIDLPNWTPRKNSCLCSKHFEEKCFRVQGKRRILKESAIPTKFIPVKLPLSPSQPALSSREKNQLSKLRDRIKKKQKNIRNLRAQNKRVTNKVMTLESLVDEMQTHPGLKDHLNEISSACSNKTVQPLLYRATTVRQVADDPADQQSDTGDDLSMYLKISKKSSKQTAITAGSAGRDTDKDADQRHDGFSCNNCSNNIVGYRYTCVQCLNYDLCATCEAKGAHCLHYVLRIPKPAPYAEVQSMLTAIRSHLLYGTDPEPHVEVPIEEVPVETIKVEIKEEAPDPLESDQALVTDENYASYSEVSVDTKKEFTATEETIQISQIPYNTATTTGIIDNTLVIIENPVLSEPESKRRRVNLPPPLVPVSAGVAPTSAHLAPTSAQLAPTSALLAPTSTHRAPAPDLAAGRMLDNIILYPKREVPAAVEDKDESSSFQVFSHIKKKKEPSKLQVKPGQRSGTAPASTSRSDDKK